MVNLQEALPGAALTCNTDDLRRHIERCKQAQDTEKLEEEIHSLQNTVQAQAAKVQAQVANVLKMDKEESD